MSMAFVRKVSDFSGPRRARIISPAIPGTSDIPDVLKMPGEREAGFLREMGRRVKGRSVWTQGRIFSLWERVDP
jgi:hypothetical protein